MQEFFNLVKPTERGPPARRRHRQDAYPETRLSLMRGRAASGEHSHETRRCGWCPLRGPPSEREPLERATTPVSSQASVAPNHGKPSPIGSRKPNPVISADLLCPIDQPHSHNNKSKHGPPQRKRVSVGTRRARTASAASSWSGEAPETEKMENTWRMETKSESTAAQTPEPQARKRGTTPAQSFGQGVTLFR